MFVCLTPPVSINQRRPPFLFIDHPSQFNSRFESFADRTSRSRRIQPSKNHLIAAMHLLPPSSKINRSIRRTASAPRVYCLLKHRLGTNIESRDLQLDMRSDVIDRPDSMQAVEGGCNMCQYLMHARLSSPSRMHASTPPRHRHPCDSLLSLSCSCKLLPPFAALCCLT